MLPEELTHHKHVRTFSKGQMMFSHGDAADHLWLVESGWVKLFRTTPDGRETVVGLCAGGDCFGEAALVGQGLYPCSAAAASDVRLATFSRPILARALQDNAGLAMVLLGRLHHRMQQHQRLLDQMQSLTAAQRIGCFLLRLSDREDGGADGRAALVLPLDKQVLAAALSMKPETFSRALQQLRAEGVEVHGEQIVIQSLEHLQHFVCDACSESGMCYHDA